MSARLGNPSLIIAPAAALGSAAGRSIPFNNSGWLLFISGVFTYVATATVGTRNPVLRFVDASGNILWNVVCGQASVATAGVTVRLVLSSVLQSVAVAPVGGQQLMTYWSGGGLSLPPNTSLVVLDGSNVDVTDTVQLNSAIFSY